MTHKIAVLPGDGIGHEIVKQAVRVLEALRADGLPLEFEHAQIGATAYRASMGSVAPISVVGSASATKALSR